MVENEYNVRWLVVVVHDKQQFPSLCYLQIPV